MREREEVLVTDYVLRVTTPMPHLNIELKACCTKQETIRDILRSRGADFRGTDSQTDTYFIVPHGRLKLREGNIENALVH